MNAANRFQSIQETLSSVPCGGSCAENKHYVARHSLQPNAIRTGNYVVLNPAMPSIQGIYHAAAHLMQSIYRILHSTYQELPQMKDWRYRVHQSHQP